MKLLVQNQNRLEIKIVLGGNKKFIIIWLILKNKNNYNAHKSKEEIINVYKL